jgi:hypothetical protein
VEELWMSDVSPISIMTLAARINAGDCVRRSSYNASWKEREEDISSEPHLTSM